MGPAWRATVNHLDRWLEPSNADLLVGIEFRGFLVSAPLAYLSGRGFAMVRKRGKLPGKVIPFNYDLEYGTDTVEIQADAVRPRPSRRRPRRSAGDRRNHGGGDRFAALGRRRGGGRRLHHRARLPQRPRKLDVPFESVSL